MPIVYESLVSYAARHASKRTILEELEEGDQVEFKGDKVTVVSVDGDEVTVKDEEGKEKTIDIDKVDEGEFVPFKKGQNKVDKKNEAEEDDKDDVKEGEDDKEDKDDKTVKESKSLRVGDVVLLENVAYEVKRKRHSGGAVLESKEGDKKNIKEDDKVKLQGRTYEKKVKEADDKEEKCEELEIAVGDELFDGDEKVVVIALDDDEITVEPVEGDGDEYAVAPEDLSKEADEKKK